MLVQAQPTLPVVAVVVDGKHAMVQHSALLEEVKLLVVLEPPFRMQALLTGHLVMEEAV